MGRVRRSRTFAALALLAVVVVAAWFAAPVVWPAASPSPSPSQAVALATATPSAAPVATSPSITQSPDSSAGAPAATPGFSSSPASGEPGIPANRVTVPSLGIDLPVVEGDGVDAPMDLAAHYPGTSWPGGGSNIYLYAHARKSMFQNLWNAQLGDLVYVDLVDGSQRVYQVSKIEPDIAWDDLSVLDPTPTEQLTLQTCTGTHDTDPRFLVIATPVS